MNRRYARRGATKPYVEATPTVGDCLFGKASLFFASYKIISVSIGALGRSLLSPTTMFSLQLLSENQPAAIAALGCIAFIILVAYLDRNHRALFRLISDNVAHFKPVKSSSSKPKPRSSKTVESKSPQGRRKTSTSKLSGEASLSPAEVEKEVKRRVDVLSAAAPVPTTRRQDPLLARHVETVTPGETSAEEDVELSDYDSIVSNTPSRFHSTPPRRSKNVRMMRMFAPNELQH